MRQSLKTGLTVLIVTVVATTGIALAIDDGGKPLIDAAWVTDESEVPDVWDPRGIAGERIRDRLQPLVDDEVIDGDQADAVAEHLADGIGIGPRFDGRHAPRHHGGFTEIAEVLGLSFEEMHDRIAGGATIDDLLDRAGLTAAEFVDGVLGAIAARLDEAVADGAMTPGEQAEILERAEQRLADLAENGFPSGGPGIGPHHGHGGGHRGPHHGFPGDPGFWFDDEASAEDAVLGV